MARWKIRKGRLEEASPQADLIVENTFRVPYQEHAYLEPEAGVAWIDERGVLNIRVSTQVIEHFRSIARAVGIAQNQIRIQGTMVGGGFGGKEDMTIEIYLALLAQATARPVKLVYTREESILAHAKRHPYIINHRTGVKKNGLITASKIEIDLRLRRIPLSLALRAAVYHGDGAGSLPGGQRAGRRGFGRGTNNPYTSAFRGFGGPQACFAYEQQMDDIARQLGLDPLEVRRATTSRQVTRTATGQPIESAAWLEERPPGCWGDGRTRLGESTNLANDGAIRRSLTKIAWATASPPISRLRAHHLVARHIAGLGGVELDGTVTRARRRARPGRGAGQQPVPDRRRSVGRAARARHHLLPPIRP